MNTTTSSALASILASEENKLLACVHCGLCLESCPTYVATGNENDSPRGRIYLMRAVEEGRLKGSSHSFEQHINRCLGCRACEAACPAGVEYGQLLEAARAEIVEAQPRRGFASSLLRFLLRRVWLKPNRLRLAFRLSRLLRDSGLPGLLLKTKLLRSISPRLEFALALLDSSRADTSTIENGESHHHEKSSSDAFAVFVFKACVTNGLFQRVNEATSRVLAVNGCEVQTAEQQVCCGALHAHAGDLEGARILARQNIDAFRASSAPIITNAGGCGSMLASYAHLLADDEKYIDQARQFSNRVRDVGQQLEDIDCLEGGPIGSQPTSYDASCHLLHGQHAATSSLQMLLGVPDLNFAPLQGSDVCCGGAGVYNLLEPKLSGQVLAEKLKHIEESGAEVLATGNAGCHMQIAAGARLAGMKLKVCHPIELLDESYRRAGFYSNQENGKSQTDQSTS